MKKRSLAITIRSFDTSGLLMQKLTEEFSVEYINSTGSRLSEEELLSSIKDTEYVIAGTEPFSARVLESSKKLKAISRVGVGTDSIDGKTAKEQNIRILNTPEAPVIAVAEHALALILTILKNIPSYNNRARIKDQTIEPGHLLQGKTVGIVGLGRIGFRLASLVSMMGCRVRYFDPYPGKNPEISWKRAGTIEDLFSTSDIISLHAPPGTDGTPLVDERIIRCARPGMVLINTARGSLIDEKALEDAIKNGIIRAAGLDVFSKEPYSGTLLNYPQVIITPHVASNTQESRRQMEEEAVENIIRVKRELTQ